MLKDGTGACTISIDRRWEAYEIDYWRSMASHDGFFDLPMAAVDKDRADRLGTIMAENWTRNGDGNDWTGGR
jgi:hypothetical protein